MPPASLQLDKTQKSHIEITRKKETVMTRMDIIIARVIEASLRKLKPDLFD